jgi:hypothetical protein
MRMIPAKDCPITPILAHTLRKGSRYRRSIAWGLFLCLVFSPVSIFAKLPEFPSDSCGLDCEKKNAEKLLESLDRVSAPSFQACEPVVEVPSVPEGILGARELMAQIYGSCDVLKLPNVENFITAFETVPKQPYLHWATDSSCINPTACRTYQKTGQFKTDSCLKASCNAVQYPPMYLMGGKVNVAKPESNYAIHPGGVSGIDCSGFVSVAMAMRGLRLTPTQKSNVALMGTVNLIGLGAQKPVGNPVDCFDRQQFAPGVASGDLIVQGSDHVVMVDTVGKDPLGFEEFVKNSSLEDLLQAHQKVKKDPSGSLNLPINDVFSGKSVKKIEDQAKLLVKFAETVCDEQVDEKNFRFSIIHSSAANHRIGVQRAHAAPGLHDAFGSFMEEKGVQECIVALKRKWEKELADPMLIAAVSKYKTADMKTYDLNLRVKLLRHRSDYKGCKGEPFKLQSSPCSSCCDLHSTYEGMNPEGSK